MKNKIISLFFGLARIVIISIIAGNFIFSAVATNEEGETSNKGFASSSISSRLWGIREQEIDYLFTTCKDLVCILDEEGRIQRLNDHGADILGWNISELLGKSHIEFVHPEDKEKTLSYLYGSHVTMLINRYQRKDGSYCWLDWVSLPDLSKPTPGGNPILFARDVTLQKTFEDKTRKALATTSHHLTVHNRILEMVVRIQTSWVRDSLKGEMDEEKNLTSLLKNFLYLTNSELAVFRYNEENSSPLKLLNPIFKVSLNASSEVQEFFKLSKAGQGYIKPFESFFETILETLQPLTHTELNSKDLQYPPFLKTFIGFPLIIKNKAIGAIGLINTPSDYCSFALSELQPLILLAARLANDIRLYKEVEAQRVQALQMVTSASKAKTTFISHLSHEMRTPLTGIIGLLNLIDLKSLTSENSEYIEGAQSSAVSLLSLLSDVLDISKIEAGQYKLEEIEFNPFRIAQEAVRPFYLQAEKKGVGLKLDVDSDIPDHLIGDPTRLRQVLSNLLSNAFKFTAQGEIEVSLKQGKNLSPPTSIDEDKFILRGCVKDTGIGISPEAQRNLFQPFTQAETSTSRYFGGTGLGLSIIKSLCELMGGTIKLKSQPDKGSKFTFQVALRCSQRPPSPYLSKSFQEEINLNNVQILLAEDNLINQKVIKTILLRKGCQVTTVNNGFKAVEAVNSMLFDIVLMDGHMAEMDGVEATMHIRKSFSKEQLPIIAVTAHAMKEEEEMFFQAGINGYVTKPIQANTLISEIGKCLYSKSNVTPSLIKEDK